MDANSLWDTEQKTADGLRVMVSRQQLQDLEEAAYERGQNNVWEALNR